MSTFYCHDMPFMIYFFQMWNNRHLCVISLINGANPIYRSIFWTQSLWMSSSNTLSYTGYVFSLNWPVVNGLVFFISCFFLVEAFMKITMKLWRKFYRATFFSSFPKQINFLIVSKGKFERPTANQIVYKYSNSPFVSKYYWKISIQIYVNEFVFFIVYLCMVRVRVYALMWV